MRPFRFLSLFSGIEAASVAAHGLPMEAAAFAEIEPFCCRLLADKYPHVPNLGNVELITEEQIIALGHIDGVFFGSPCQDISVAGKRAGLKGERSGLFFAAMRIVRWSRARWTLFENVPGLFSSNDGADFAAVVGEMAGLPVDVPDGGWPNSGVHLGADGLCEYAVLDAQYFGVPQRRRRIFALRDTGDWFSRPPILLEPYSLQGHPAPRREAGKDTAHGVAPSLTSSGRGVERAGESRGQDPVVAVAIAGTLQANGKASGSATQQDAEAGMLIAHSLRAEGFDASEDGSGRATPLVAVAVPEIAMTLTSGGKGERGRMDPVNTDLLAFSCKDHGADAGDIAPTLRSMGHDGSHANAGGQVAVAFVQNTLNEVRLMGGDGQITGALGTESGMKQQSYLAFNLRGREGGAMPEDAEGLASIRAASGGSSRTYVGTQMAVRRLTPLECDRLQGFPDRYTLTTHRGKPAADGPRYKALGNSWAVPCVRWILERMLEAHGGAE